MAKKNNVKEQQFEIERVLNTKDGMCLIQWKSLWIDAATFNHFKKDVSCILQETRSGLTLVRWKNSWVPESNISNNKRKTPDDEQDDDHDGPSTEDEEEEEEEAEEEEEDEAKDDMEWLPTHKKRRILRTTVTQRVKEVVEETKVALSPKNTYRERDVLWKGDMNNVYTTAVVKYFRVKLIREFHLDAETGRTFRALQEAGVPSKNIFVANDDPFVCQELKKIMPHNNVYQNKAVQFLKKTTIKFQCAYLDGCGGPDARGEELDAFLYKNPNDELLTAITFTLTRQKTDYVDFNRLMKRKSTPTQAALAGYGYFIEVAARRGYTCQLMYHSVSQKMHFVMFWLQRRHK